MGNANRKNYLDIPAAQNKTGKRCRFPVLWMPDQVRHDCVAYFFLFSIMSCMIGARMTSIA